LNAPDGSLYTIIKYSIKIQCESEKKSIYTCNHDSQVNTLIVEAQHHSGAFVILYSLTGISAQVFGPAYRSSIYGPAFSAQPP